MKSYSVVLKLIKWS